MVLVSNPGASSGYFNDASAPAKWEQASLQTLTMIMGGLHKRTLWLVVIFTL